MTGSNGSLPPRWTWAPLEELVVVLDHQRVPVNRTERESRRGEIPYYGAAGQVGWIHDHLFDEDLVLLGEDGVQFFDQLAQKAYIVRGKSWVNNHAHVLRPLRGVSHEYLCEALNSLSYAGAANGTTRLKLTKSAMLKLLVPLPPAEEQQRLVTRIQQLRQTIADGRAFFETARQSLRTFRSALLRDVIDKNAGAHSALLGDVADIGSGVTKGRRIRGETRPRPFLRAANLRDGYLDLDVVKDIDATEADLTRYALKAGDLLLVEGSGSPDRLGQGWLWEGQVDGCIHQNHVFRARPDDSQVLSRYLAWAAQAPAAKAYFRTIVKTTSGLATINKKQLSALPVPMVSLAEQRHVVARLDEALTEAERYREHLDLQLRRVGDLERSLRYTTFTGGLTRPAPGDGSVSDLRSALRAEHLEHETAASLARKNRRAVLIGE